jgi:hypothetical protein
MAQSFSLTAIACCRPVNFTAAGMLFRNFHTLDGVSGSAVYLNQTDQVRKRLHPSPLRMRGNPGY